MDVSHKEFDRILYFSYLNFSRNFICPTSEQKSIVNCKASPHWQLNMFWRRLCRQLASGPNLPLSLSKMLSKARIISKKSWFKENRYPCIYCISFLTNRKILRLCEYCHNSAYLKIYIPAILFNYSIDWFFFLIFLLLKGDVCTAQIIHKSHGYDFIR